MFLMSYRFISVQVVSFFCFVAAAVAVTIPTVPVAKVAYVEPEAPANYEFEYSVQDQHSGDVKQQKEGRAGDAVHGSYSLIQPDGVQRIVEYTADKVNGFNAIVRYEGQAAPAPAKIAYAAAPVAYAAPVAKAAYAAPVAKVAYAAPVGFATVPLTYAAAPVAKLAYSTNLVAFFCFVAAAAAIAIPAVPVAKVAYVEPEIPANYEFEYSVQDQHSGDVKQQKEGRAGDAVHGSYSLIQPDGVQRIVEYTADKVNGFNAIVRYEGQPAPVPAKIAYAAAPVAYAAPVAKVAYAAPVDKVAYAAPVAYAPAPVTYAAAPVAKLAYSTNLGQVSYSSPVVSYQH
ncbi:cuticle protein-like [Galleria mellonella]|uniref:Cuticle protein-like n=1 Tax=Galleria mellonella TaxID=7137 RepID=A0ABM3MMC6_GALME|nr:cuticle protein-like [Galleria mellonella]